MANIQENDFNFVLNQIQQSKQKAYSSVNSILIELYWEIGKHLSLKTTQCSWGKGVVKKLAEYLKAKDPTIKGFSDKNLWRMKQFYETYHQNEKLSTLSRQLSWSNNEALDRDVKQASENPSIGVLLCREKNDEIVEYALSRSLSPTVISEYKTKLIPKKILQKKLNELYKLIESEKI